MRELALEHLQTVMLPFWKSLRDDEHGGFYGEVDFNLAVHKDAPKGGILCARILYFFSTAARVAGDSDSLVYARHAYNFLRSSLLDTRRGGVYWSVDHTGAPLDTTKHLYCQSFAVYGLSAYYMAGGEREALDLALKQFRLIETKYRDTIGYWEEMDAAFRRGPQNRLADDLHVARRKSIQKTMNSILHLLEAYTELFLASGDTEVGEALARLLELIDKKIIRRDNTQLEVFFDENYNSLEDIHSFGHDIEASWLIDRACEALASSELTDRLLARDKEVCDSVLARGWDKDSLWKERVGNTICRRKGWWEQAETIVGLLNQWQRTAEAEYLRKAGLAFDFCLTRLVDPRPGSEWFAELGECGEALSGRGIVDFWKCPYHSGRMLFEIMRREIE